MSSCHVRRLGLTLLLVSLVTACSSSDTKQSDRRTPIGETWEIEGNPDAPRRLYALAGGTPRLVDEHVVAYHGYLSCLVYESAGPTGTVVFSAHNEGKAPVMVATSEIDRPWDFDLDGMRRYRRTFDAAGSRIEVEFLDQSPLCDAAYEQGTKLLEPKRDFVDVHWADGVGNTSLHMAAKEGRAGLADALVRAGINVNTRNRMETTPLMVAATFNKPATVERLLRMGADVNARDRFGMSPLIYAGRYQGVEPARLLLEAGADPSIRDEKGRSAADWARQHKNAGVLALLERTAS